MNTGPALRITSTRNRLAAAVGTRPRKAMIPKDRALGMSGTPSLITAIGMTMAAAIIRSTVDRPMGSTFGKRRIKTLDIP